MIASLERFTILMYDRTSTLACINRCRKVLFSCRWHPYPQQKQSCISTSGVQHTRQATTGGKQPSRSRIYLLQEIGVGSIQGSGNPCGQYFHKLVMLVMDCFSVNACHVALHANLFWPAWSAPIFILVMANVKIHNNEISDLTLLDLWSVCHINIMHAH